VEVEARESSQRAQFSEVVVPEATCDATEAVVFSCMRGGDIAKDAEFEISTTLSGYKVEVVVCE
jgi:hypothetical protein